MAADVEIVELPVDPVGDPGGRKLAAAIRAHLELEKATRRRRRWIGALAFLSVPAVVEMAFPSALGARLRLVELCAWFGCALSFTASFVTEIRFFRLVQRSVAAARGSSSTS